MGNVFKARCKEGDPLKFVNKDEVYYCQEHGYNVVVCGTGLAMSRDQFDKSFEEI